MKRKTFIQKAAGLMLIGIPAYSLIGCSSSDDGSGNPDPDPLPAQGNCLENGTTNAIGGNHGHNLVVSASDVNAGVVKTYSIMGSGTHDHSLTISAANFNSLKINQSINVTSSNDDGHSHAVTVSCA